MFIYCLAALLIGAIPFSSYAHQLSQQELHKISKGDPRKSRVFFLIGPWFVNFIGALDIIKAALFTAIGLMFFDSYLAAVTLATLVLLGECYSPLKQWQGSNGILCLIGTAAVLNWQALAILCGIYLGLLIFLPYRQISLGVLLFIAPWLFYFYDGYPFTTVFSLIAFIIFTIKIIPHIKTFLAGREPTAWEEFKQRHR